MPQSGSLNKSFIPKGGAGSSNDRSRSSFAAVPQIVGGVIFFAVALAALGLFLYEEYLANQIVEIKNEIAQESDAIDRELQRELQAFDVRLDAGNDLLATHHAPSRILDLIGVSTLSRIQFDMMELAVTDQGVMLVIEGLAPDFSAVAAQADQLRQNDELQSALVSDLSIEQDEVGDMVAFTMEAQVRPSVMYYRPGNRATSPTPTPTFEADEVADETPEADGDEDNTEAAADATSTQNVL